MYKEPEDIDLYVGLLYERGTKNSILGPTNLCINADQFIALKKGDRFFYTNDGEEEVFNAAQREALKASGLAQVICTTMGMDASITPFPFIQENRLHPVTGTRNRKKACQDIGEFSFGAWKETSKNIIEF